MRREWGDVGPGRLIWDRVGLFAIHCNFDIGEICGRSGKGRRERDEKCEDEEGGGLEQVHLGSKAGIEKDDTYTVRIKDAYERRMNNGS